MTGIPADGGLATQAAVVTGGASGIGQAVALQLQSAGVRAVSWDMHQDADIFCDVSDQSSVAAAMAETVSRAGTPTMLVASAGVNGGGTIVGLDPAEWDRVFSVNARGVFLAVQPSPGRSYPAARRARPSSSAASTGRSRTRAPAPTLPRRQRRCTSPGSPPGNWVRTASG